MTPKSEVINGDCMELLRQLPDKSFKIAIVDPPYGLSPKSTQGSGKLKNRTLNQGHISRWDVRPEQEYFDELMRVSENQIIWAATTSLCRHAVASWCGTSSSRGPTSAKPSWHGLRSTSRPSW